MTSALFPTWPPLPHFPFFPRSTAACSSDFFLFVLFFPPLFECFLSLFSLLALCPFLLKFLFVFTFRWLSFPSLPLLFFPFFFFSPQCLSISCVASTRPSPLFLFPPRAFPLFPLFRTRPPYSSSFSLTPLASFLPCPPPSRCPHKRA